MKLLRPLPGAPEFSSTDTARCAALSSSAVVSRFLVSAGRQPRYDAAPDNASAEAIRDAVNGLGIAELDVVILDKSRAPNALAADWIVRGYYLVVGVNCTSNCVLLDGRSYTWQPRHWVAAYSTEDDYFNCWYNTFERHDLDAAHNWAMNTVAIGWRGAILVDEPQPTGGASVPEADDEEVTMASGRQPAIERNDGTLHDYKLDNAGDVYHFWWDAQGRRRSELIGQNGSTTQGWHTGLAASTALEVFYSKRTATTHLFGQRLSDGLLWHAAQADAGAGWVAEVCAR